MQRIFSKAFPSTTSNVGHISPFFVDRRPPPNRGKCESFKLFIWNEEKRTFCNRTLSSWAKIICFYLTFMTVMFGLFIMLLLSATNYIKKSSKTPWIPKNPTTQKGYPGVSYFPNDVDSNVPLIWLENQDLNENAGFNKYVQHLDNQFKKYRNAEHRLEDYSNCTFKKSNKFKPCFFKLSEMGDCGVSDFGYSRKTPCVYLKINKVLNWQPIYFEKLSDLPNSIPSDLKTTIINSGYKKHIWVHCEGVQPHDWEHIEFINYFPSQGINGNFFPYEGDEKYLQPLIAVQFGIKPGYIVEIRCTIWTKNVNINNSNAHSIEFQLYVAFDTIRRNIKI